MLTSFSGLAAILLLLSFTGFTRNRCTQRSRRRDKNRAVARTVAHVIVNGPNSTSILQKLMFGALSGIDAALKRRVCSQREPISNRRCSLQTLMLNAKPS